MSALDSMDIMGIRAFDHQTRQRIQFYKPLTLIVGYNGSGKTTIIECLKYATTGDMPPNSKGGAFIHDPKFTAEHEIKAQVKLKFVNTAKSSMTLARRIQLDARKAKYSVKTLESSLTYSRQGEKTTVSSRTMDLESRIPAELGVSKALLDNVIFCHQDDSLWPMSEASVLKKKFDEIFEAQKYTKAVDHIRVVRKNLHAEIKKKELLRDTAKNDKDRGDALKKSLNKLEAEHLALDVELTEAQTLLTEAHAKRKEANQKYTNFDADVKDLDRQRQQLEFKKQSLHDTEIDIGDKVLADSDAELQRLLDTHQERLDRNEARQSGAMILYNQHETQRKQTERDIGEQRGYLGRFQSEKEQYEAHLSRREQLAKENARRHRIHGYEGNLSRDQVEKFIEKVSQMAREQQDTFRRAEREMKQELNAAQKELHDLNIQKSSLRSSNDASKSRINELKQQIESATSRHDKFSTDEGAKARLEATIEDLEGQLDRARKERDTADVHEKIKHAVDQVDNFDQRKIVLQNALIKFNAQSQQVAKIDVLSKTIKESKRSLETLVGVHSKRFTALLGQQWKPADLEDKFSYILAQRQHDLKDAERQQQGVAQEHAQLSYRFQEMQSSLKSKRSMLEAYHQEITKATTRDPRDFPEVLSTAQENRDTAKSDVASFHSVQNYYEKCIKTAEDKNACRTCKRSFDGVSSKSKFVKMIQDLLSKSNLEEAQEVLATCENDFRTVQNIQSAYESWHVLTSSELPALQRALEELEQMLQKQVEIMEQADAKVSECQIALGGVEALSKPVASIVHDHHEIERSEAGIQELSQRNTQADAGRSLSSIQSEMASIDDDRSRLQSKLGRLRDSEREMNAKIVDIEAQCRDDRSRLTQIEFQLAQKSEVAHRIQEMQQQVRQQQALISDGEARSQAFGPQISQAQARVDDIDSRWTSQQQELRADADQLDKTARDMEVWTESIESYEGKKGEAQLRNCQRDIRNLEDQLEQTKEAIRQTTVEVNKLRDEKTNSASEKRSIQLNVKLRADRKAIENLQKDIDERALQNSRNDIDHWYAQYTSWDDRYNALKAKEASIISAMGTKDSFIKEQAESWDKNYADAHERYRHAHIDLETTKAAVEDLGRYANAMDNAIMVYHQRKMEEINRTLQSYWMNTYRGTDVDTILIKSENDTALSATRKSYNYRVVMLKQGVEMDMRGRCSAGQKVLASILIRLALAECFGVRCGMIALDEPTTNLDFDNIRSLAESLHDIVQERRRQSNFQLVIITHDEDFLRYLRCGELCQGSFWRVTRNEKQHSIIEKHDISELGDD